MITKVNLTLNIEYTLSSAAGLEPKTDVITLDHDIKPSTLAVRLARGWALVRETRCEVLDLCIVKVTRVETQDWTTEDRYHPRRI